MRVFYSVFCTDFDVKFARTLAYRFTESDISDFGAAICVYYAHNLFVI